MDKYVIGDTLTAQFSMLSVSSISLAFLCTFFSIPFLIRFAKSKHLLDRPNERKIHKAPIPTLGGIGIFLGLLMTSMFWLMPELTLEKEYPVVFSGLVILFFMGLHDDLKELPANGKFVIQWLIAAFTVWGGVRFTSFHGFLGIEELPLFWQYGFSMLLITGVINAFNLLDGLDGLAGGISLINCLAFYLLFTWGGDYFYALLSLILAGSLAAFLYYNFNPARIFMGDSGSLLIGYLMAVMGLKAISPSVAIGAQVNQSYLMGIVFAILLLPVADTFRVFVFRIIKGASPFSPDKNHIHHIVLRLNITVKYSALLIYVFHASVILLAFALTPFSLELNIVILLSFIALFMVGLVLYTRLRKSKNLSEDSAQVSV